MGKIVSIIVSVAIASSLAGLSSCAKNEKLKTPTDRLVGKWMKTKFATDDNIDGIIEDQEISAQPTAIDNELFFKSDKTGNETTIVNKEAKTPLNFTWELTNKDSLVVNYTANSTVVYNLVSVSSHDLTLTTQTDKGLAWYYYVKL